MFEAYSVAIRLRLVDSVSSGLGLMAGQFRALNSHVGASNASLASLEGRLKSIKMLGLVGGVAAGVGFGGLALFKAPLEEAKQFQTEVARFAALGLGDKVTGQAVQFAKGMNVMGQSARDNLHLLREATSIMGDFGHAEEAAPILARMKFGLESVMGSGQGAGFEQMFQAAIKTTELRGALVNRDTGQIDIKSFSRVLNMMTQAYVASGGLVKPQDYLAAIKTGGVSTKLMNDEAFFFGLGHFMQESGGSRTGTASMSMFQNWAMGRMPQRIAERMADMGLLDKKGIHYGKTGHVTGVDPMALLRGKEFIDNPFKYVNEVVVPLLQKKGLSGNDLNIQLASLLGIRTASNLADQFVREQKIADLYVTRARRASGVDALYKEGGNTLTGKELDLRAKWHDALREIGDTVLPIATRAVTGLTGVLKGVIHFAREFPGLTKGIVIFGATLFGLVAVGGVLSLATAGFKAVGLALAIGKGVGLGAQLLNVADGFGAVASRMGKLGMLAGVGIGAYEATRWLADSGISKGLDAMGFSGAAKKWDSFSLGGSIYDALHSGNGSKFVPNGKRGSGGKTTQVNLNVDGRRMASVMFGPMADMLSAPLGGANFDGSLSHAPVLLNQGH